MLNTPTNLARGLAAIKLGIPGAFKLGPDGSPVEPLTAGAQAAAAEMLAGFDAAEPLPGTNPEAFAAAKATDFEALLTMLPAAAHAASLKVIERLWSRPMNKAHPAPPYFDRQAMDDVYQFVSSDVTGLC